MSRYKKRTQAEKNRLLKAYHESGLSATEWCKKEKIAFSTLGNWIRKERMQMTFIPLTEDMSLADNLSSVNDKEKNSSISSSLKLDFNTFSVVVNNDTSMELLAKVIRLVNEYNV